MIISQNNTYLLSMLNGGVFTFANPKNCIFIRRCLVTCKLGTDNECSLLSSRQLWCLIRAGHKGTIQIVMSDGHLTQSSAPGQDTSPSSMWLLYPIVKSGSLIFITNKATSNDQAFCVTTTLKIWNFAFWKWHSLLQFIFLITFYVHFLAKVIFILDKRPPTWLLPCMSMLGMLTI